MCYPCIIKFGENLTFWSMGAFLFQKEVYKQLLPLTIAKFLIKQVNKNILLFYVIAERFLDQHHLFYGDNFFTDVLFWSFSVFKTIIYSILKSVTKWCPLRIYQVNLMWTFRLWENSLRLKCKTWDFYEFNIFFLKYYVKTKT